MSRNIYKYRVFLDSNAMRDVNWVKQDFFERLDKLRGEQLADVEFYLPEIIKQEWVNYFLTVATTHQTKLGTSSRTLNAMGLSKLSHTPLSREDIKSKASSILEDNKLNIIETPYDSIDWSDLMRRAVEHIPPFEKAHDKGIKDGVFAQTIRDDYVRHRRKRNVRFAIITHDNLLKEYMKEICPGSRVSVHDSLEDFKSVLKLAIEDKKADLLAKAKAAFYTANVMTSLYWSEKIHEKMISQYSKLVGKSPREHVMKITGDQFIGDTPIPPDETWTPLDKKYEIKGTYFIGRSGGRFKWMTVLTLKQAYGLTTINNQFSAPFNNPASVVHTVLFAVDWSCRLDSRGNIERTTVDNVKVMDELASVNPYASIDWDNLTSGLTRSTPVTASPITSLGALAKMQESLASLGSLPSPQYQKTLQSMQPLSGLQAAISRAAQPATSLAELISNANETITSTALQDLLGMNLSKTKPEESNPPKHTDKTS